MAGSSHRKYLTIRPQGTIVSMSGGDGYKPSQRLMPDDRLFDESPSHRVANSGRLIWLVQLPSPISPSCPQHLPISLAIEDPS